MHAPQSIYQAIILNALDALAAVVVVGFFPIDLSIWWTFDVCNDFHKFKRWELTQIKLRRIRSIICIFFCSLLSFLSLSHSLSVSFSFSSLNFFLNFNCWQFFSSPIHTLALIQFFSFSYFFIIHFFGCCYSRFLFVCLFVCLFYLLNATFYCVIYLLLECRWSSHCHTLTCRHECECECVCICQSI